MRALAESQESHLALVGTAQASNAIFFFNLLANNGARPAPFCTKGRGHPAPFLAYNAVIDCALVFLDV